MQKYKVFPECQCLSFAFYALHRWNLGLYTTKTAISFPVIKKRTIFVAVNIGKMELASAKKPDKIEMKIHQKYSKLILNDFGKDF
ncbi:MAG: hypothetical protein IIT63_13090 [Prevotella sp.]|nr:hypothetical protein [Prevotella sp.]